MTKKHLVELATYNNWADHITIEWLQQIRIEQWKQNIESSFSSIEKTTTHIVSAKRIWVDFWKGVSSPIYLSTQFEGNKNELIEIWNKTSTDLAWVIQNYPERDYQKPVDFVYPNARKGQMIFWHSFLHFINHATYHRGQLVTLLNQVGFTNLSNTDLGAFFIENMKKTTDYNNVSTPPNT